jgi:hypothetical protein
VFPLHDTPGDFYRFTRYGLAHLFSHWSTVDITPETGSWETLGVLLQRMALQCDFHAAKLVRLFLFTIARTVKSMNRLTKVQYGNVATGHKVDEILVSGWYVVAHK